MKKFLFSLILVVFLAACARVEIKYYPNPQAERCAKELKELDDRLNSFPMAW